SPDAEYSDLVALALATIEPSLAGPKRPQDRVRLKDVKVSFENELHALRESFVSPEPRKRAIERLVGEGGQPAAPMPEPDVNEPHAVVHQDGEEFDLVGYGCTTCIGNSGPLPKNIAAAIDEAGLVVASVLSGNRNFEGRIHSQVRANYLASPPLCVAFALAGHVDVDLTTEPLGTG